MNSYRVLSQPLPDKFKLSKKHCSNVDIKEKMSPNLIKHFNEPRDQDTIGWCYGFAAADMISAKIGEPVSSAHVSANLNRKVDQSYYLKFGWKITRKFKSKNAFEKVYEGGLINMALEESIKTKKLCSESDFPFDKQGKYTTWLLIRRLEKLKKLYDETGKSSNVICQNAISIINDNSLNINPMDLLNLLKNESLNINLTKIIAENCKNKIPIPKYKIKNIYKPYWVKKPKKIVRSMIQQYFKKIKKQLEKGKPIGIEYDIKFITPFKGGHASVVTGMKWVDGKCLIKVRNSWGKGCESYDSNEIESCNKESGEFLVNDKTFFKMVFGTSYIE
jgi:hypothetical protein